MRAVGIDFGTTNSVVAVYGPNGPEVQPIDSPPAEWAALGFDKVLPSVYARDDDGAAVFGWAAKMRADRAEAVKRLFAKSDEMHVGGQAMLVEEVATHLFSALRQRAADVAIPLERAVVTVPANSRGLARHRTKICAGMAGIEVAALLNEPTAAAMAFGLRSEGDQNVLVVDWGGGTLDVTLLEVVDGVFLEQASKGVQALGGIDFDKTIYRHVVEDVPGHENWSDDEVTQVRIEVERAKILLSSQEETTVGLPGGQRKSLTRRRATDWVRPHIERVRDPIERCLADLKATTADIDALLLVGGTCKMPAVADMVAGVVDQEPVSGVDPITAVAEGACVAAAILSGEVESDFYVATEHALGVISLDRTGREFFSVLIPRNMKLPAKATDGFVPVRDFQDTVELRVIEGDPERPLEDEDNVVLRTFQISIPPQPIEEASFTVTYEYDTDGILHVAMQGRDGDALFEGDVSYVAGPDPRQLVEIAKRVKQAGSATATGTAASTETGLPTEVSEVLRQARDKVIPFVDEHDADALQKAAASLEEAARTGDYADELQTLEAHLRTYSYLL